jgi:glycosyltransferase involved in cell wall biosynthesis
MAKVTAIISAYYAESYLQGRIENLLQQSEQPEIIVVCQKDSVEYQIAYCLQDEVDIKIITTEDIPTIYEAWNMAIKEASGEYLTSANSDDRLYPKALEKLSKVLDDHSTYAVSYFFVDRVDEIDKPPTKAPFTWMQGGLEELVYKGCFLGPMPMWRKSLHDKHGYFLESDTLQNGEEYKYQVVSDYEFWMRLAAGKEKFYRIPEVLGAYLDRPDSAEKREPLRHVWESARVRTKYKGRFEKVR